MEITVTEGTITALVEMDNEILLGKLRDFVANHTDGINESEPSDKMLMLSGSTFSSDMPEIIDGLSSQHHSEKFLRIIYTNEYGEERFWIINQGHTSTFSHNQDDTAESVVLAYKEMHEGLGGLWLGINTKDKIKSLKKLSKKREKANSDKSEAPFHVEMLPHVEKSCLRVLQLYLQSKNLAEYSKKKDVEEYKLVENALSNLHLEAKRCIDKGRELVDKGFDKYSAETIKEYLNERVAAAFSMDGEHRASGLSFSCEMSAIQIGKVTKELSQMNLWEEA